MTWGLAWYWNAVILGLLIPWVTMYRDMRGNFDQGITFGLGVWLGVSAVAMSAIMVLHFPLSFLIRWVTT